MLNRYLMAIATAGFIGVLPSRASPSDTRTGELGHGANRDGESRSAEKRQGDASCTRESAFPSDEVTLDANGFSPWCILLEQGETLLFSNADGKAHSVTSDPGLPEQSTVLDSGVMAPGAGYPYTFYETGEFGVHCRFHAGEHATVIVE